VGQVFPAAFERERAVNSAFGCCNTLHTYDLFLPATLK
jgi:hypothetical protein